MLLKDDVDDVPLKAPSIGSEAHDLLRSKWNPPASLYCESVGTIVDRFPSLVIAFAVLVLTFSFWLHPFNLPTTDDSDAFTHLAFIYSLTDSVWHHGEYPLWNPYLGGGIPWAGYPHNPGLSPNSLLYLLLGEVLGVKVWIAVCLFLGGWGMVRVGREWLMLDETSSLMGALLLVSSLWSAGRLVSGNYDEFVYLLLPFCLSCFLALLQGRWLGALLPLMYMGMLAQAKYAAFLVAFVLLMFALLYRRHVRASAVRILVLWGVSLLAGVLFSMPKILPLLGFMRLDLVDQDMGAPTGYRHLGELLFYLVGAPCDGSDAIGIGLFALVPIWIALCREREKSLGLMVILILSMLLSLGANSLVPLWRLVEMLPILGTMHNYGKYWNGFILFSLCGLVAVGLVPTLRVLEAMLQRHSAWRPDRIRKAVNAAILVVPALVSWTVFQGHFGEAAAEPVREDFHHVSFARWAGMVGRYRVPDLSIPETVMYHNMRRDVGTITWYGNFVLPENAQPRFVVDEAGQKENNGSYRGEASCLGAEECRAEMLHLTYNTVTVAVDGAESARRVVLNFNHHPGWTSDVGSVVNHQGLVAVDLPPGQWSRVALRYSDGQFMGGFWIFVVSALGWLIFMAVYGNTRNQTDSP